LLASLSPTTALTQAIKSFGQFEVLGIGQNFDTFGMRYHDYSVQDGIISLAICCVYLFLLGIYMENVMPKTYGQRRNPCFCFLPSYWCAGRRSRKSCKRVESKDDTKKLAQEIAQS